MPKNALKLALELPATFGLTLGTSESQWTGELAALETGRGLEYSLISTISSPASKIFASSSLAFARRQAPGRNIGAIGPETLKAARLF